MDRPEKQPTYTGPERRLYPRQTLHVPIELQFDGFDAPLCAETTDLSRNGCYLRLQNPLPVGLRVQATLWLNAVPIEISGRIVTRHPDFGNGIMFLRIRDRGDQVLAAYLAAVTADATL
jgi:hypothetical protein